MAKDHDSVKSASTIDELPDSSIPETPAGQDSNQAGGSSVSLEDILASPKLQELIDKQVQSKTDSRLGKYGTRLDVAEEAIAKYDALVDGGMSKPEAKARIKSDKENDDLRERLKVLEGGNIVEPSTGVGGQSWGEKQQTILDKAGVAKDDPRITELLRDSSDKQDFIAKLEEQTFAWKQADAKKPQPSSSTVAQIIPSVIPETGELDAYTSDQLGAKMITMLKEPSKYQDQIDLLNKELVKRDAKKG